MQRLFLSRNVETQRTRVGAWRAGAGLEFARAAWIRVRVEIMGAPKYRIAGKSQPLLIMNDPTISTHTRICSRRTAAEERTGWW
eukprot:COSAG01_NODE_6338_length_3728_cov_2.590521_3_plen_84_part_00